MTYLTILATLVNLAELLLLKLLIEALDELRDMYAKYKDDPDFLAEFHHDLKHFVGRPSPIYFAERLPKQDWRS